MSSKSNIRKFQNIVNGDMSLASITSLITDIQFLDNVGLQFKWTGTPVGTFAVNVSIDYAVDINGNVINAGTWIPINLPVTPAASGSAGSAYIDLNQLSAPWIQVVYTKVSGTGTLQSFITAKPI